MGWESVAGKVVDYWASHSFGEKLRDVVLVVFLMTWLGALYVAVFKWESLGKWYQAQVRQTEPVNLITAVEMNKRIDDELEALRVRTGGDRAFVSKFHDGRRDLQNIHFIYNSRTNEVVGPGIGNSLTSRQNIPLTIITDVIREMMQEGCALYLRPDRTAFSAYMSEFGTKSAVGCAIHDARGDMVGIIGVEYLSEQSESALKNDIALIKEFAQRVGALFDFVTTRKK